jgi:hypothetical protein
MTARSRIRIVAAAAGLVLAASVGTATAMAATPAHPSSAAQPDAGNCGSSAYYFWDSSYGNYDDEISGVLNMSTTYFSYLCVDATGWNAIYYDATGQCLTYDSSNNDVNAETPGSGNDECGKSYQLWDWVNEGGGQWLLLNKYGPTCAVEDEGGNAIAKCGPRVDHDPLEEYEMFNG